MTTRPNPLSLLGVRLAAVLAVPAVSFLALVALDAGAPARAEAADPLARGEYLLRIMDCGGCHTPRDAQGAPREDAALGGGDIGFAMPGYGVVWPPNLTPDATGLGGWSDAEIAEALTTGRRPDGRALAPVMPWPSYAVLSEADLSALIAALRALPPVAHATPEPVEEGQPASAPYFTVAVPQ
ncbi:c-type cytochrome [Albimonas pacifica]|uniref:Cytochrome c domain-containing protein n=1 Tax=Albimonas pacifica TaxID=1114924 RepID=A0A1I3EH68_9RHOB|nr:hypothetical protein [Albimonas pacifica]SFH98312.1 hypothetical protein SAMN05216258_103377 [Albimonas pacifica]